MSIYDLAVWCLWGVLACMAGGQISLMVITWRYTRKQWKHDFSHFKAPLERLLRSGYDSGFVRIQHKSSWQDREWRVLWEASEQKAAWPTIAHMASRNSVQFRKYIHAPGEYGIELTFPNAHWSGELFPKLVAYCEEHDIAHRVVTDATAVPALQVLTINCGQDVDRAFDLALAVWTDILGFPADAPYQCASHGVSPWGDLIDRPDYEVLTTRQGLRLWSRESKERSGLSSGGTCLMGVAILVFWFSSFGLCIATLSALGDLPDWRFDLAGVTARGSTAGLTFLVLLLVSYAVARILASKRHTWRKVAETRYEKAVLAAARFALGPLPVTMLPIALILVWTDA